MSQNQIQEDYQHFQQSIPKYKYAVQGLFTVARNGPDFGLMRSKLTHNYFSDIHPRHMAILLAVVNDWEAYFKATGRQFSLSPTHTHQKAITSTQGPDLDDIIVNL